MKIKVVEKFVPQRINQPVNGVIELDSDLESDSRKQAQIMRRETAKDYDFSFLHFKIDGPSRMELNSLVEYLT